MPPRTFAAFALLMAFACSPPTVSAQVLTAPGSMAPAAAGNADSVLLQGRVVDMYGQGVPAAEVHIVAADPVETPLARGFCDGDGAFRIPRVPLHAGWFVTATAKGKNVGKVWHRDPDMPARVILFDAVTLRGVLRNHAGEAVAGSRVRGISYLLQGPTDEVVTTGADGSFALHHLAPGLSNVLARVPGEGLATWFGPVASDQEIPLASKLGHMVSMTVQVVGLAADVARATCVELSPDNGYPCLPPPWLRPHLDADGRCLLTELPDLNYTVRLLHATATFEPKTLVVKAGGAPHAVMFRCSAPPAAILCQAVLRTDAGQPLANVPIELRDASGRCCDRATSKGDGAVTLHTSLAIGSEAYLVSADDRWALDQSKERNQHGAQDPSYANRHECSIDPTVTLYLQATPACTVHGRVLRPDGGPAGLVDVQFEQDPANLAPRWNLITHTITDATGRFTLRRLHVCDGKLRVRVLDSIGYGTSDTMLLGKPGLALQLQDLRLTASASISGIVRDASGKPAPGIRVWLQQNDDKTEVISDQAGHYAFVGVPAGSATFRLLWKEGRNSQGPPIASLDVVAARRHQLDLQLP